MSATIRLGAASVFVAAFAASIACGSRAPASGVQAPQALSADGASSSEVPPSVAAGEALLKDGLVKRAAGDVAAPKILDRARAILERATAETMVFEPTVGLWDVSAIAWSGDGAKLVVAAGSDIHVYRGDDFSESLRLPANAPRVTGIAISTDARALVSAGEGRDPEVWDLLAGRRTATLERPASVPHEDLSSLAFSPDGTQIAGRAWETASPTLWRLSPSGASHATVYEGPDLGGIRAATGEHRWPDMLAFSPDGTTLASVYGRRLMFWDLRQEETVAARATQAPVSAHDGLSAVAFHPNGQAVAVGSEDGKVMVWNSLPPKKPRTMQASHTTMRLAFGRDGASLLSVSADGQIRTFAAKTLALLASQKVRVNSDAAVAPRADASGAAIASSGGLVVVDAASGKSTDVARKPVAFSSVAVSQDSVALGTVTGSVLLISLRDGSFDWLRGHTGEVMALAFSPDGAQLATVARDATAHLWDVGGRKNRLVLKHARPLNTVAFRPDGHTLATGGDRGLLTLWEAGSGRKLASLDGVPCTVLSVAYSPDGTVLAAAGSDRIVRKWNGPRYVPVPQVEKKVACEGEVLLPPGLLGFTSDGKTMVSATLDRLTVEGAAAAVSKELRDLEGGHVRSLVVQPGEPVAVVALGNKVRRWRLLDGAELPVLSPRSTGQTDFLAFSPDGRWLFGASRRGGISLWSAAGTLQLTFQWMNESTAIALTPSGLAEWMGTPDPSVASCRLGTRIYPRQLCEERYRSVGLVSKVIAGVPLPAPPSSSPTSGKTSTSSASWP